MLEWSKQRDKMEDVHRRLETIERVLHGNGQPGLLERLSELDKINSQLQLQQQQRDLQHAQNRRLQAAIFAALVIQWVGAHWLIIAKLLQ